MPKTRSLHQSYQCLAFVGQSGIICCRRHVAKVPTAALKGTQESQGRRPRPWKGKVVSQGSRVLEDARKISRPAELGFVVLGIILLPGNREVAAIVRNLWRLLKAESILQPLPWETTFPFHGRGRRPCINRIAS